MEIHELLVLKNDGRVERFPVSNGDVAQAELRASLCQRPGDDLVVVTEHAYVRVAGELGRWDAMRRPDGSPTRSSATTSPR